jgi:hypothetical protein
MKAIKAKSQPDAQAALSLLRSDILRAHTNSLSVEGALVILRRAGSAVDQGDWETAQARVLELKAAYEVERSNYLGLADLTFIPIYAGVL